MAVRAAVAGASGYAGGELLRLLLAHPEVEIGALTGNSNAGQKLGALQPHLLPLAGRVLQETTPEVLAGHDVVFLALPHGQSAAVAEQLGPDVLVVDMGADFRLKDAADWERFYGSAHACHLALRPARTPGLPGRVGFKHQAHRGARLLPDRRLPRALPPAYAAGLAENEAVIVAASGTSGVSKAPKAHLLGSEVMGSMSPYGVGGGHRHTPRSSRTSARRAASPSPCPSRRPSRRCPAASSPRAAPRRSPVSPASPCAPSTRRPSPTNRSCTCSPRGAVVSDGVRLRFQRRSGAGRVRRGRGPHHRDQRHRQPDQRAPRAVPSRA